MKLKLILLAIILSVLSFLQFSQVLDRLSIEAVWKNPKIGDRAVSELERDECDGESNGGWLHWRGGRCGITGGSGNPDEDKNTENPNLGTTLDNATSCQESGNEWCTGMYDVKGNSIQAFCATGTGSADTCKNTALDNGYTLCTHGNCSGSGAIYFCTHEQWEGNKPMDYGGVDGTFAGSYQPGVCHGDRGAKVLNYVPGCVCGIIQIDYSSGSSRVEGKCGCNEENVGGASFEITEPSPSPSPSPEPSPSVSPSPNPSATPSPSPSVTPSPTPSPSPSVTPSPSPTPIPSPSVSPSPSPSPEPGKARFLILKYDDGNKNAVKDSNEGTTGRQWRFQFRLNDGDWHDYYTAEDSGYGGVHTVDLNTKIEVREIEQSGWTNSTGLTIVKYMDQEVVYYFEFGNFQTPTVVTAPPPPVSPETGTGTNWATWLMVAGLGIGFQLLALLL